MNIYHSANDAPEVLPPNSIVNADCFDVFDKIETASIDMICTDLPYGTTACKWDILLEFNDYIIFDDGKKKRKIGLDEFLLIAYKKGLSIESALEYFEKSKIKGLWSHYKRVLKPSGVVVLTASQPFTSVAVMSNLKWFKYNWVWDKVAGANFMNIKNRPFKTHEDVLIFAPTANFVFNPQRVSRTETSLKKYAAGVSHKQAIGSKKRDVNHYATILPPNSNIINADGKKHPISIIKYNSVEKARYTLKHPTKKPLGLFKYLIQTYTNAGMRVLDNCAGSGTTGAACIELGREFILMEKEIGYFNDTIVPRLQNTIATQNSKLFNE